MPRRVEVSMAKGPRDIRDRFALQIPLRGAANSQTGRGEPERFQTELRDDRVKLTTKGVRLRPYLAVVVAQSEKMGLDDINEQLIVDHDIMRIVFGLPAPGTPSAAPTEFRAGQDQVYEVWRRLEPR